jgi:hypothetical protein
VIANLPWSEPQEWRAILPGWANFEPLNRGSKPNGRLRRAQQIVIIAAGVGEIVGKLIEMMFSVGGGNVRWRSRLHLEETKTEYPAERLMTANRQFPA